MTSVVTAHSAESRLRVPAAAPLLHRALVPVIAVWCVAARTFVAGTWAGYSRVLDVRMQVLVERPGDPERAAHYCHAAMIANGIARRLRPIRVECVGLPPIWRHWGSTWSCQTPRRVGSLTRSTRPSSR
jgi:hypothetical protein